MGEMQYLTVSQDRLVIGPDSKGASFTLKNPTTVDAIYKVKFTAPERATIRPSSGFVAALDQVEVIIEANKGFPDEARLDLRSSEKILICATKWVPKEGHMHPRLSPREAWKQVDKKDVFDTKISVKFAKKSCAVGDKKKEQKVEDVRKSSAEKMHLSGLDELPDESVFMNRKCVSPDATPSPPALDIDSSPKPRFQHTPNAFGTRKSRSPEATSSDKYGELMSKPLLPHLPRDSIPVNGKMSSPGASSSDIKYDQLMSKPVLPHLPRDSIPVNGKMSSPGASSSDNKFVDADEESLPAISSSSESDNDEKQVVIPPPPARKASKPSLLSELIFPPPPAASKKVTPAPEGRRLTAETPSDSTVKRDLTKLKSEMLETDSSLMILKKDQVELKQNLDKMRTDLKERAAGQPANDSFKSLEDRMVALYHKSQVAEQGLKKVGYKLDDMTEKLINSANDQGCRTKENVDRIAVTLSKMETRINQLAGKMELQDETMRQTCATKGQMKELEGQICGHLEKIGSNLAKRQQVSPPPPAVTQQSHPNGSDTGLVVVAGVGVAAAFIVVCLAVFNKK